MYAANILDIESSRAALASPDKTITPKPWKDISNRVCIKINNLEETKINTTKFLVQVKSFLML